MEIKLLKRRELKKRGFLPEVVLPEKVEVELERVEFALLNPKGTRLIFKPRIIQK